jgi:hypothetical protein
MSAHHFSGRFFIVDVDEAARLLRMTRTAAPFASPDEMQRAHREVLRAVAPFRGHRLLLDVGAGPARNETGFEKRFASLRKQIVERFERVAILVKSAVGGLHATRLAREDRVHARIFQDESLAFAYLEAATRR